MTEDLVFKKCKACDWSYGNVVLLENILSHIRLSHKKEYGQAWDLLMSFTEAQREVKEK